MSITSLTRSSYLLVFRDGTIHLQESAPRAEMGSLLHDWLEWHDRLEAQGKLRFRCPVDPKSRSVSKQTGTAVSSPSCEWQEPVVGYLLVEATNLEEATEVALGCPGLAHGFTVEIYSPYERGNECATGSEFHQ